MDNKAYLQSIAVTPPKPPKRLSRDLSKYLKIGLFAVIILSIIIITLTAISSFANKPNNSVYKVQFASEQLLNMVEKYNPHLKSPALRKINASLKPVLIELSTPTKKQLTPAKSDKNSKKSSSPTASAKKAIDAQIREFTTVLDDAKINAQLDRTYRQQITYQITLLATDISESTSYAKNLPPALVNTLNESYKSLTSIHNDFANFSDPSV